VLACPLLAAVRRATMVAPAPGMVPPGRLARGSNMS